MKGQKKENSLETIEIHPNQKLCDRAMLFISLSLMILRAQSLWMFWWEGMEQGVKKPEESDTAYLVSRVKSPASRDVKDEQGVHYCLTRIVGY